MDNHDDALFINPEPGVHDGCFLITKPRCPVKLAQLNARLAALPVEPPPWFVDLERRMAKIEEVEKQVVVTK